MIYKMTSLREFSDMLLHRYWQTITQINLQCIFISQTCKCNNYSFETSLGVWNLTSRNMLPLVLPVLCVAWFSSFEEGEMRNTKPITTRKEKVIPTATPTMHIVRHPRSVPFSMLDIVFVEEDRLGISYMHHESRLHGGKLCSLEMLLRLFSVAIPTESTPLKDIPSCCSSGTVLCGGRGGDVGRVAMVAGALSIISIEEPGFLSFDTLSSIVTGGRVPVVTDTSHTVGVCELDSLVLETSCKVMSVVSASSSNTVKRTAAVSELDTFALPTLPIAAAPNIEPLSDECQGLRGAHMQLYTRVTINCNRSSSVKPLIPVSEYINFLGNEMINSTNKWNVIW